MSKEISRQAVLRVKALCNCMELDGVDMPGRGSYDDAREWEESSPDRQLAVSVEFFRLLGMPFSEEAYRKVIADANLEETELLKKVRAFTG
jgi:hypothetical protein